MDVKGEIYNMSLCSTTLEGKDHILELSLTLKFKALEFPEFPELAPLFEYGETQSVSLGRGTAIRKGTYRIDIGESFDFKGQLDRIGYKGYVYLMLKSGYIQGSRIRLSPDNPSVGFLTWIADNFRKMIDMRITEIRDKDV